MSAKIRVQYGKVWIEIDAESPKSAITQLSDYTEVFVGHVCGLCESTEIAWSHREHGGHDYYSVKCVACGAERNFGQHKNGRTLFAKGDWSIFKRGEIASGQSGTDEYGGF